MNESSPALDAYHYPRPQFVRPKWLNLNGVWEFEFDDANRGLNLGWQDGRFLKERIIVPFPYQSELSGINDKAIHEIVWYAKSFEVPKDWREDEIILHFGAVDYRAIVWVNGSEAGQNKGGHVPFSFNISPYLKSGENRITLRVEDSQNPYQPRGKQSATGLPVRVYYYNTTGIWQTVWLEPVPKNRIEQLKITTSVKDEQIEIEVYLHAPFSFRKIKIEILENLESDEIVSEAEEEIFSAAARIRLKIPDAKKWSPAHPHLYKIRVRLSDENHLLDTVESYAGVRTVELKDGRYILNGEPVYLAMVLDQGYWAPSFLAAPSAEALREDVEWVKKFGFNGARKHQKIEDPRWLYWCDVLGLFVWEEMPSTMKWSLEAEESLLAEWERVIRRDFNHPSIITWVPLNESWGFPGLRKNHPGQSAFLERIVIFTHQLDPFRPVIDNDGWEHTGLTDVCAIHDYTYPSDALVKRYAEKQRGGALPSASWYKNKQSLFLKGSEYRNQPIVLSEIGGFLLKPPGENELDRLYDIYGTVSDNNQLLEKYYDLLINGLAKLTFLAGFCYTQLTDIEQELNGLLTYDRKPKIPPERIAEINRQLLKAVD